MGPIAGRHARDVLTNVERIIALELLVGAQALDLRLAMLTTPATPETPTTPAAAADGAPDATPSPTPGRGVAEAHGRIRSVVAPLLVDREMGADIAAVLALVRGGELAGLVDAPDDGRPLIG